jgi:hypothetical protein
MVLNCRRRGAFHFASVMFGATLSLAALAAPRAAAAQSPLSYVTTELHTPENIGDGPIAQEVEQSHDPVPCPEECWRWSVLPVGLIYHSYLAAPKEPRFASAWLEDEDRGSMWDATLGFRQGILRRGTLESDRPVGFQVDIDGAVFARILPAQGYDLMSADFRVGIPITYGGKRFQTKLEFYHLSSHVGDEFTYSHPGVHSNNYTWDGLGWGNSYYLTENLRLYEELDYGYGTGGGAKPLEIQFGVEYSPVWATGMRRGSPFLAMNTSLRETVDYSGSFVLQTGWQWRNQNGGLLRLGMEYYTGMSDQNEFFQQREDKIGLGIWYDF